jgi:tetratricopeptide (TPR) repeat protein
MAQPLQSTIQQVITAFQNGNFDLAESALKQVLQADIDSANTIFELGLAYARSNGFTEALAIFSCLLAHKKNDVRIPYNMGLIYSLLGKHQLALEAYDIALSIQPLDAEVLINKGSTCNDLKNYVAALETLERAIQIRPDTPEAWSNKGIALNNLNRHQESLDAYNQALQLDPSYADAWSNKSVPLNKLKRYQEASEACDKALSLRPNYAEAYYNKSNALYALRRFDEVMTHLDKALSLKPNYHEAWANKGVILHELARFDEAIAHFDKALGIKPDYHDASWNKSLSFLVQGNFEGGLPLYESRWKVEKLIENSDKRSFAKPVWLGSEPLNGKTILLYGEQGLGDFIQFCRYAKLVANLGAKVILEAPESLASLMGEIEGVSQVVVKGEELPTFDYQCPLLSLPLAFKTNLATIPNASPYIHMDGLTHKMREWQERLGTKSKPRVGLVWSGNSQHDNDHNRSLLLKDILPFLPAQFEYISLQKEVREVDKPTLQSNSQIRSFTEELIDFSDTAALTSALDLVISVDTSVAHLSAALGKKTLVLLPHTPDWRWLLDRSDSPWYPSMKLYRQSNIGDWKSALSAVKIYLDSDKNFQ